MLLNSTEIQCIDHKSSDKKKKSIDHKSLNIEERRFALNLSNQDVVGLKCIKPHLIERFHTNFSLIVLYGCTNFIIY